MPIWVWRFVYRNTQRKCIYVYTHAHIYADKYIYIYIYIYIDVKIITYMYRGIYVYLFIFFIFIYISKYYLHSLFGLNRWGRIAPFNIRCKGACGERKEFLSECQCTLTACQRNVELTSQNLPYQFRV